MKGKVRQLITSIVFLFVLLIVVFMFLGLEMSSSYTRDSPDCSVWCVIGDKIYDLFNINLR